MEETTLLLKVPDSHPCFSGHFPGNPIVPGALLIQWIIQNINERLDGSEVSAVSSIKFTRSLTPGDSFTLVYRQKNADKKLRVECESNNQLVCKAVLLLD